MTKIPSSSDKLRHLSLSDLMRCAGVPEPSAVKYILPFPHLIVGKI